MFTLTLAFAAMAVWVTHEVLKDDTKKSWMNVTITDEDIRVLDIYE